MCETEEWEEDKEAPSSEFNFKTETRFGVDRFSRFVRSFVSLCSAFDVDRRLLQLHILYSILFYFIFILLCCDKLKFLIIRSIRSSSKKDDDENCRKRKTGVKVKR